jgi:hypothetical protein
LFLPVAVQYAWDKNSPWAKLFNKDGLPALIFHAGECPINLSLAIDH